MEKIIVLDFGGQYTQLIARSVRQSNVFSDIMDCETPIAKILAEKPKGIILSGGPDSVYQEGAPIVDKQIFHSGVPILGICYGMQLIAHMLSGRVVSGLGEYGNTEIFLEDKHPLFFGLESSLSAWMSHGDSVHLLPNGFKAIGKTKHHIAAIADDINKIYGVQFHPEVTHTLKGKEIISNFIHRICGCGYDWTTKNFIEDAKNYLRQSIGKNDVICFVSGGVDSSFVAALLSKTKGLGSVYPVYIDALMRKNETEEVVNALRQAGVNNLIVKKAEDGFIDCLKGLSDPEEKRIAIGNYFGKVQQQVCEELHLDKDKTLLAQGTLYTDLIESGKGVGKRAAKIKSHHNVGCEFIEELKKSGRVVEPNRLIFKDEVRQAAKELGLPESIWNRQPFPGPGLAIRIVDSAPIDSDFEEINDNVNKIAQQFGLQGYALPIKTVGVQGDERTYRYLALLRGKRDWNSIRQAAEMIPSEVKAVNRVVYDIGTEQLPRVLTATVPTKVTRETVDLLKEVDFTVRNIIESYGFPKKIDQTIVVLFASDFHNDGKRSVCLRAVLSPTYMTVSPVEPVSIPKQDLIKNPDSALSWQCLDEIRSSLLQNFGVGSFVIDVTDKPPATTCWE